MIEGAGRAFQRGCAVVRYVFGLGADDDAYRVRTLVRNRLR